MDQYREFLDAKWLDEFDAWRGAYKNPFRDLSGSKRYRNWDSDAPAERDGSGRHRRRGRVPEHRAAVLPERELHGARAGDARGLRPPLGRICRRTTAGCATTSSRRRRNGARAWRRSCSTTSTTRSRPVHWAAENGLRGGVLLPGVPPDSHLPPLYANDVYEPLWDAFEETGLPVNHHSGSAAPDYGRYPAGGVMWILETGFYAHRAFWALIFGGVFERHPKLKFVLAESGMGWIADEMPRTDYMAKRIFGGKVGELGFTDDQRLPKLPSEYFQQNIWVTASFMAPAECRKRHKIGVDKIMWASDYPHDEGTYPYSEQSLRNTFHDVPENRSAHDARPRPRRSIYDFDLAALQPIADRVGLIARASSRRRPKRCRPTRRATRSRAGERLHELVDLDWSGSSRRGRAQMRETGACEIPGFVRPKALPAFIDDARRLAPLAHRSGGLGTVYLGFPDESFPLDHPQQWLGNYDVGAVAYDLFPADSPIRRLYEWDRADALRRRDPRARRDLSLRRSARRAEPRGDGRRRPAAVALRPDRLRRVARGAGRRRRRRLRGRAADPHRRRRALRRRRARARGRARRRRHAADDAGHAARVRGPLLVAPRAARSRARRRASSRCSATTRSRARCRASC